MLVGHIDVGEILSRDKLVERVAALKGAGQRIVFTNGCFDLLHPGHIVLLEKCRFRQKILREGEAWIT